MKKYLLILGDILAILITTLIGFATHGEVGAGSPGPYIILPRMAATFFPLVTAWFLLAPFLGLFRQEITSDPKHFWRPGLVMIFAAPLATVLRGFLLNAPIIPIFAVVLAVTSALGMLLWRVFWYWIAKRRAGVS